MRILGIETSCDETAAAVVEDGVRVLSNVIFSQVPMHQATGGVVPEVAAREHVVKIMPVIEEAVVIAGKNYGVIQGRGRRGGGGSSDSAAALAMSSIDAIAVTQGPGLLSSLVIGTTAASTLAAVLEKPLVGVNHIAGHIYANWLNPAGASSGGALTAAESGNKKMHGGAGRGAGESNPAAAKNANRRDDAQNRDAAAADGRENEGDERTQPWRSADFVEFPCVVLTASGGHNELVLMRGHDRFELLGETLDDAAGEAFDKVARLLGMGYPGGPLIARAAHAGNALRYAFPKAYLGEDNFDFSFSGLKTAMLNFIRGEHRANGLLGEEFIADCAASFQEAVCGVLSDKLLHASQKSGAKTVLVSGGVSANRRLREMIAEKIAGGYFHNHKGRKILLRARPKFNFPADISFCTDNAAMIAGAAYFHIQRLGGLKKFARGKSAVILGDPNLSLY